MGGLSRQRTIAILTLLLLASAINYMDRQTLANVAVRITRELTLTDTQYGHLETSFGLAFALGSLFFGFLADRISVRWLYPGVLLAWSFVGFLTGFVEDYEQLLACRAALGFFEAGHWPCGLKATQRLLAPERRALGNSLLQSGTSIGAMLTPFILGWLMSPSPGGWRIGFQVVGAVGSLWVVLWWLAVRRDDLLPSDPAQVSALPAPVWWRELLSRRMLLLLAVLTLINSSWQILRAWLPKIMQTEWGYSEIFTLRFTSVWYAATDVGCLGAGALAAWLIHRGWSIKASRVAAMEISGLLAISLIGIAWLPAGVAWLGLALCAGAGPLGAFPIFYAFSQDVSRHHQGKVTGVTGVVAWGLSAPTQSLFGWLADTTHTYRWGLMLAACLPLMAAALLHGAWPEETHEN